ncbi:MULTISPECIES: BCCT family transporter [unclassified Ruegeria]|uniref:BCCT family transporter n=1 Tax=unclassified Ruegeria TaxID=2625375 RepID=UPI001487C121|nr:MULTISPECIES: BCCT family transporter [unclassified Ruegeria]NOD64738.1 BCCT family transporter [Ruegeria sp. HKCCD6109]
MPIKPPVTDLPIKTADSGFYRGFTKDVTITAKLLIGALVIWAVAFPDNAASVLSGLNSLILASFNFWYVYVMAFFFLTCIVLAILPVSGRMKLGRPEDQPEFSRFSWFSMMFGAGIGIGMLTYATGEPIYHFQTNPDIIQGLAEGSTEEAVRSAYKWSFSHWGLHAWASYAIVGLALAYFSFRRGLPLTIRSALTPIFGKSLSGPLGHVIDVVAVVATVLGVAQTLGFGVNQFIAGLHRIGFGDWLLTDAGDPTKVAIAVALLIIVGASTLSALSGVGKGIKWLSNINMALSFALLAFFLFFGSTLFGLQALFVGIYDYLIATPALLFTVWNSDGVDGSVASQLAGWQGGWTVFYWAWWIAFAPFVGVFLARISKGRTIREYVLGAAIVPSVMCFVWFALVGGTAIELELSGVADNAIIGTGLSDQLFATLSVMLSETMAWVFAIVVVVLLLTYLVTSADSAVLIINTINAAGDEGPKARPHILFWGAALALVVGALLMIGGLGAIQTAMIIGALPFSVVMVLMGISVLKAIWRDSQREKLGLSVFDEEEAEATPAE